MNYNFSVINKDEKIASFTITYNQEIIDYKVKNNFIEKILNLNNDFISIKDFLESRSNYNLNDIETFVKFMKIFRGVTAKDDYFILVKEV